MCMFQAWEKRSWYYQAAAQVLGRHRRTRWLHRTNATRFCAGKCRQPKLSQLAQGALGLVLFVLCARDVYSLYFISNPSYTK